MAPSAGELRTIALFQGFNGEELAGLSALFRQVESAPDRPLFDIGERATELYLLTAGEVVLDRPNDDQFRIHPPALIGELGALTNLPRSTRAMVAAGSVVWSLAASALQAHFANNQELGVRFLANLLSVVAEKVHRDQRRMADMRGNLVRTQKEIKRLRELVLETVETPLSAPVHDTLERLIMHNRRVNYRVEPPPALAAKVRLDHGLLAVTDLSRTHVTVQTTPTQRPEAGSWLTGVLTLAGTEIPISGKVKRAEGDRVTIELDLLIDEYVAILEGYLTRVQLLDILV